MTTTAAKLAPIEVIRGGCAIYGLTVEDLVCRRRTREMLDARILVVGALRDVCGLSFKQIACAMHRASHSGIQDIYDRWSHLMRERRDELLTDLHYSVAQLRGC